jgi:hypothetical protein
MSLSAENNNGAVEGDTAAYAQRHGRCQICYAAKMKISDPRAEGRSLPDISPYRLRGHRRLEDLPVVVHRKGLRKISRV